MFSGVRGNHAKKKRKKKGKKGKKKEEKKKKPGPYRSSQTGLMSAYENGTAVFVLGSMYAISIVSICKRDYGTASSTLLSIVSMKYM